MSRRCYSHAFAIVLALGSSAIGCASSPRQRPVAVGEVEIGPGSLTAARQQLEGHWTLVTLAMFDDPAAPYPCVDATGVLVLARRHAETATSGCSSRVAK